MVLDTEMQTGNGFERTLNEPFIRNLKTIGNILVSFRLIKSGVDSNNRFFIGEAFLQQKLEGDNANKEESEPVADATTPPNPENFGEESEPETSDVVTEDTTAARPETEFPAIPTIPPAVDSKKFCEICSISVTSEQHMRLHLNGAKHAKKLKTLDLPPYSENVSENTILTSLMPSCHTSRAWSGSPSKRDYSVFRTPSGQYYCPCCNVTLPNENLIEQHFNSKKHLKQANTVKQQNK